MVQGVCNEVDVSLIMATSHEFHPSRCIQGLDYPEPIMVIQEPEPEVVEAVSENNRKCAKMRDQ